ncbi:MAG: hypothetical protein C0404_10395 [Verrucomicrobia bacterium]|nr:hypothetical protein [Verrucomicrobiota bacterium]
MLQMESGSFGFGWKSRGKAVPALLTGWRLVRRLSGTRMRIKHPVWVLDYAFHEAEQVRVGSAARQWQPRLARTAHLYPPDTIYWEDYPVCREATVQSAHITFFGGDVCGLPAVVHPRRRYGRFFDPEGKLGSLIEEIARIGHREGDRGFWKAQAVFCSIVDMLLESEPVEDETRSIRKPGLMAAGSDFVRSVDAYLAGHLAGSVTLPALAQQLNVSVSKLSHRYRAETGESPMARLIGMRINLARALIIKGQPLKAVAESTGFCDAFHLSRTFKQVTGLPPRAYLASMRKEERRLRGK